MRWPIRLQGSMLMKFHKFQNLPMFKKNVDSQSFETVLDGILQ